MNPRPYLPSMQFLLVVLSILAASGLIYSAQIITGHPTVGSISSTAPSTEASAAAADHSNWEASLYAIQAQEGSSSLPQAPDENTVDALRQAAQSTNLTDTIGKTLLVNLTDAASQGLGPDAPTQDKIIQGALGQAAATAPGGANYTQADLIVVADSAASQKAYGNALAALIAKHTENNYGNTLIIIDNATSYNQADELQKLKPIADTYQSIASALLQMPVPQTLAPFHLELVNNFNNIAATYGPMETLLGDPIKGMVALQNYQSLTQETLDIFTDIAQALGKDAILFDKSDPGSAWAAFLKAQQQQ